MAFGRYSVTQTHLQADSEVIKFAAFQLAEGREDGIGERVWGASPD